MKGAAFSRCDVDQHLQRYPCACMLTATYLGCVVCLKGRQTTALTLKADDASSWRLDLERGRCFLNRAGADAQAVEN